MGHIVGQQDTDLHHDNGEHRSTPPTTSGTALARYEARIRAHLEAHRVQGESEPTGGNDHA